MDSLKIILEEVNDGRQRVVLESMQSNDAYHTLTLSLLPGIRVKKVKELLKVVSRRHRLSLHCEIAGEYLRVLAPRQGSLKSGCLPDASSDGRIPIGFGSDGAVFSEGSLLVTGALGTGKTTLLRAMERLATDAGMETYYLDRHSSSEEIDSIVSTLRHCASGAEDPTRYLFIDNIDMCSLSMVALSDVISLARDGTFVHVVASVSGAELAMERILLFNFMELLSFRPGIHRTYMHRFLAELGSDEALFSSGGDHKFIRIPNVFTTD